MQETQETRIQFLNQRRCPGVGNSYPFHYSCLENSMDIGAWQALVHGVAESNVIEHTHIHAHTFFLIWVNLIKLTCSGPNIKDRCVLARSECSFSHGGDLHRSCMCPAGVSHTLLSHAYIMRSTVISGCSCCVGNLEAKPFLLSNYVIVPDILKWIFTKNI